MAHQTTTYSATSALSITPSDTAEYNTIRAVYVGSAGNLAVQLNNGNITFAGVNAGSILPIQPNKILATGTTATNIIALF